MAKNKKSAKISKKEQAVLDAAVKVSKKAKDKTPKHHTGHAKVDAILDQLQPGGKPKAILAIEDQSLTLETGTDKKSKKNKKVKVPRDNGIVEIVEAPETEPEAVRDEPVEVAAPAEVAEVVAKAPKAGKGKKDKKNGKGSSAAQAETQEAPSAEAAPVKAPRARTAPAGGHRRVTALDKEMATAQAKADETGKKVKVVAPLHYIQKNYGDKLVAKYRTDEYNYNVSTSDRFVEEDGKWEITITVAPNAE